MASSDSLNLGPSHRRNKCCGSRSRAFNRCAAVCQIGTIWGLCHTLPHDTVRGQHSEIQSARTLRHACINRIIYIYLIHICVYHIYIHEMCDIWECMPYTDTCVDHILNPFLWVKCVVGHVFTRTNDTSWLGHLCHTSTMCHIIHYTHCNTLQHTAAHCNTVQHSATQCNITRMNDTSLLGHVCQTSTVCHIIHVTCHRCTIRA